MRQRGDGKGRGYFLWKSNRKSSTGNRIFVHHRIVSAVKRVEFVSDRMSYTVLKGRWCNTVIFSMHAANEKESNDSKDSFYEELEQVFDEMPNVPYEHFYGILMQKWEMRIFSNRQIGNASLHHDSNDNGVRIGKFATSKSLVVKSTTFLHRNKHNYT